MVSIVSTSLFSGHALDSQAGLSKWGGIALSCIFAAMPAMSAMTVMTLDGYLMDTVRAAQWIRTSAHGQAVLTLHLSTVNIFILYGFAVTGYTHLRSHISPRSFKQREKESERERAQGQRSAPSHPVWWI